MRLVWVCLLVAIGAGSACKKLNEKVELVDREEREQVVERVLKQASDNATMSCPRPVLRGQARDGTADADIIELLYGDATRECLELAAEKRDAIEEAIRLPVPGANDDLLRVPVRLLPAVWLTQEVDALPNKCMQIPDKLSAAVSHENACSPFLPGRRGDMDYMPMIDLAWATTLYGRATAAGGGVSRAADVMLDYLRLSQDIARGGTSLVAAMIGSAGLRIVVPDLALVVASPRLTADELRSIKKQLAMLVASELTVVELMRGESTYFGLFMMLPCLHEPGWVPPGGFPSDLSPREEGMVGAKGAEIEQSFPDDPDMELQGIVLALVAFERGLARTKKACPTDATAKDCLRGFDALDVELGRQAKESADMSTVLVDMVKEAGPRQAVRKRIIDILEAVALPSYRKYAGNHLSRRAALQALMILVDARLDDCQTPKPSDRVALGEPLQISRDGNTLIVESPSWIRAHVRAANARVATKPASWRRVIAVECLPPAAATSK